MFGRSESLRRIEKKRECFFLSLLLLFFQNEFLRGNEDSRGVSDRTEGIGLHEQLG